MAVKEEVKIVKKIWGLEEWLVNCEKYCGKLLYLDKGAISSLHYHKEKQETFTCLMGQVGLHINDRDYMLNPYSRPKTIMPGDKHQFIGITNAVILEISTQHREDDVVRLSISQPKQQNT